LRIKSKQSSSYYIVFCQTLDINGKAISSLISKYFKGVILNREALLKNIAIFSKVFSEKIFLYFLWKMVKLTGSEHMAGKSMLISAATSQII